MSSSAADLPEIIVDRYRVLSELGRGGMATVYRVHDPVADREVALKRLHHKHGSTREPLAALFAQEFHSLAQIVHPRIVQVYDYAIDDDGPFYTMELLDGGDLRSHTPLAWSRLCGLLRDVCSAIALLHARRLVHRDITPANIHCTADGKAKLIDLGAMAPIGTCKQIVGTPPFIAPEVVQEQRVDERTDLFALGASAYLVLTGRHAYPARSLSALRDTWRCAPPPPSFFVKDIPGELDELVTELLHLDAVARPSSAAAVMERLGALAGLEPDEQLQVRRAYLATPELVGRSHAVGRIRASLSELKQGKRGTIVVSGPAGVGRSRFLQTCAMEGKLAGVVALSIDASDAAAGDWSAAQALIEQLSVRLPEATARAAAPHLPGLALGMPALAWKLAGEQPVEELPCDSPQAVRAATTEAITRLFSEVEVPGGLLLVVDDLHRLDAPSATALAWIASAAAPTLIVAAGEPGLETSESAAAAWLAEGGKTLRLQNLSGDQTATLMRAMFGDVPYVRMLADRAHSLTAGNPQGIMQLAEHLVDRQLVRYQAGGWILPAELDQADLPPAMGQSLRDAFEALSPDARRLVRGLALASSQALFFQECRRLLPDASPAHVAGCLDEAAKNLIVNVDGDRCALAHAGWRAACVEGIEPQTERALHRVLARVYEQRSGDQVRRVRHLLAAGERAHALDVMLAYLTAVDTEMANDPPAYYEFIHGLPEGWRDTYAELIRVREQLGRPVREQRELLFNLCYHAAARGMLAHDETLALAKQLRFDAGLDIYDELDAQLPSDQRLQQGLTAAQARFDALPQAERGYSPIEAIQLLPRMVLACIGMVGRSLEFSLLTAMPSLEPYVPLSPALAVVELNRRTTLDALAGRITAAREGYARMIEQLEQPGSLGLEPVQHNLMHCAAMWAVGTLEISNGMASGGRWADRIEGHPLFEVNAWRMRRMLAMRQGDHETGEEMRRHAELLRMRNNPPQLFSGSYVITDALTYILSDDIVRLKQCLAELEAIAEEFPNWRPCLEFARGEYQRLRGDPERALRHLEEAISMVKPGGHLIWAFIAGAVVRALFEVGRLEAAKQRGLAFLQDVERERLEDVAHLIEEALALVEAELGNHAVAIEYADGVLAKFSQEGCTGLTYGGFLLTRARVAVAAGDEEGFQAFAERCGRHYRAGLSATLTAKYERLLRLAERRGLGGARDLKRAIHMQSLLQDRQRELTSLVSEMFTECNGANERGERALAMLVEAIGEECKGATLYLLGVRGPVLVAQQGEAIPPPNLDTMVGERLQREVSDLEDDATIMTDETLPPIEATTCATDWNGPDGDAFVPLLLSHQSESETVIVGVAVVNVSDPLGHHPPFALLAALSRSFQELGDVVAAAVA